MIERRERPPAQHEHKLLWIPDDYHWQVFLDALREEPLQNQVMAHVAHEGALGSSELLSLKIGDIDALRQLLTIRSGKTARLQGRIVSFSGYVHTLLLEYMVRQRRSAGEHDWLFLSSSQHRAGHPSSYGEWAAIVKRIAQRAGTPLFKTGTFRRLRLAELARTGMAIEVIAAYAGYCKVQSARPYIERKIRDEIVATGRDLLDKFRKAQGETGE